MIIITITLYLTSENKHFLVHQWPTSYNETISQATHVVQAHQPLQYISWPSKYASKFLRDLFGPFSTMQFGQQKVIRKHDRLRGKMSDFVIITVPADGLAPTGARPSAGTVMTISRFLIQTVPALTDIIPISLMIPMIQPPPVWPHHTQLIYLHREQLLQPYHQSPPTDEYCRMCSI